MKKRERRVRAGVAAVCVLAFAAGALAEEAQTIRLITKPADSAVERLARIQPEAPPDAKEVPFEETAAEPALTEAEKERGYLLFQRPLTEPVYPNSRPHADERLEALVAFATPGEFEPVTFGVYPVRALRKLKVRASAMRSGDAVIPADRIEVRLATYWKVGYPAYTSRQTYRRTPELLERVTTHSSPAGECQRYWVTVHVPDAAKAGLYRGSVTVWDDGFDRAVEIPLALRVLPWRLKKDPAKHWSTYFQARNGVLYKGRDEAFIRRAADNDYRAMVEYGLDMLPTLRLGSDDGKRISLRNEEELARMLAAGLRGPAPVTADGVIGRIYRDTTPGGKQGSHWQVSAPPPPEFYQRVTEVFRAFEAERKRRGWPEFVCCPMDEVHPSMKEFGAKVCQAVKAAGLRTYTTKDPAGADAADYAPYVDIWCSQPYSIPFDKIVSQTRYEYWCYPNHNAGEIKDARTMCLGGRMTYGFGFWRSGYTTLIPWEWSWTPEPDAFDYLRGQYSGCGQRVDDEGEVIPATYWTCFREGYDDSRYLYTLEQAIVEREGSKEAGCQAAARAGRELLQETWDAIRVQPRYLSEGMWPSEEFDAVRWRLAAATTRLLEFPATAQATAPSVLVAGSRPSKPTAEPPSPYEAAKTAGTVEMLDLGGDFTGWKNGTAEGKTEISAAAGQSGKAGLRWTVVVDRKNDGGEGGKYPIGWPRLLRDFAAGPLDMSRYETLLFRIRIDSSRDKAAAGPTPVGLVIGSRGKNLYETTVDLGGRQHEWIPLRFSVKEMMTKSGGDAGAWKTVSKVQLFLYEGDYADGTRLEFDIAEASLVRLTSPAIVSTEAPRHVLLPRRSIAFAFDAAGTGAVAKGTHTVTAILEGASGVAAAERRQDLAEEYRIEVPLAAAGPGNYTLRLTIRDAQGKQCSQWSQALTAIAGPRAE